MWQMMWAPENVALRHIALNNLALYFSWCHTHTHTYPNISTLSTLQMPSTWCGDMNYVANRLRKVCRFIWNGISFWESSLFVRFFFIFFFIFANCCCYNRYCFKLFKLRSISFPLKSLLFCDFSVRLTLDVRRMCGTFVFCFCCSFAVLFWFFASPSNSFVWFRFFGSTLSMHVSSYVTLCDVNNLLQYFGRFFFYCFFHVRFFGRNETSSTLSTVIRYINSITIMLLK